MLLLANFGSDCNRTFTVPASNRTVLLDLRKGVVLPGWPVCVHPQTLAVVGVAAALPSKTDNDFEPGFRRS
jgi:hypothetical protein